MNLTIYVLGHNANGQAVFLRDIWPTRSEIQTVEQKHVIPVMFEEVYSKIETGSESWQQLVAPSGKLYPWDKISTYIKHPPFFEGMTKVCKLYVRNKNAFHIIQVFVYLIEDLIFNLGITSNEINSRCSCIIKSGRFSNNRSH